jgi:hypothetical protein
MHRSCLWLNFLLSRYYQIIAIPVQQECILNPTHHSVQQRQGRRQTRCAPRRGKCSQGGTSTATMVAARRGAVPRRCGTPWPAQKHQQLHVAWRVAVWEHLLASPAAFRILTMPFTCSPWSPPPWGSPICQCKVSIQISAMGTRAVVIAHYLVCSLINHNHKKQHKNRSDLLAGCALWWAHDHHITVAPTATCKIPPWRQWERKADRSEGLTEDWWWRPLPVKSLHGGDGTGGRRTSKSGPRRADERKTAAAGAPSGEDQREPASRCLAVLHALPEGEQIDLVITDGDAGKQRWGAG